MPDAPPDAMNAFDRKTTDAPSGNAAHAGFELASVSAPPLANGDAAAADEQPPFGPRASLRNEAPRPLITEPREPVTIKAVERAIAASAAPQPASSAFTAAANHPSDVLPAQLSAAGTAYSETTSSIDVIPGTAAPIVNVAPAPSLAFADPQRRHIVVDGDSLARLAGRYLDDPQRAREIYELNRHVLADPDVLPIGAELTIPSGSAALQAGGPPPQSLLPRATAIHAAARGGLVPVRPVPAGVAVMPRAQLARPLPAE